MAGCGYLRTGIIQRAEFASTRTPATLKPDFETKVYTADDRNTADLYLTDIAPAVIEDRRALAAATGQILHVHMFLRPKPGSTPIEESAISVTVRYIVLVDGRAGVYSGGGFMLPAGEPNGGRFGGSIPEATLRLAGKTEGFDDLIEHGILKFRGRARRNDEVAEIIGRAMDRLAVSVDPVVDAETGG
ncbi:MAG: hypothetical protein AAGI17_08610 [Planctomycetota bacterium]